ncbi:MULTISPECIES: hypothetical protein [unclassified Janthinobacterium]|uniref:hypothetical protein n=1 Tax=unclassified Janthinobacterium TaxID=2610881 RepID=UPI00034792B2|nr:MULTISPECIES: hypothetical protein [unclassified Janthinobacterium]MEC5162878.1 hypothetical protein [Janthinobacterium sp. CG_S6]
MDAQSYADKAAAIAAQLYCLKAPMTVDSLALPEPASGAPVYRFTVVDAPDANGRAYTVMLDQRGEVLEPTPQLRRLFERARAVLHTGEAVALAPVVIQPSSNVLTLNPGQVVDETITVTIPKSGGAVKADVYFLADTTASMGGILAAVQAGSANVLAALNGLGLDLVYGVGNYKDFASGDPYGFQHQLAPTNAAAPVTAAINAWSASGGGDGPECALFALDSLAEAPGGGIGWRAGSKRIVVWFGDVPSHDPICSGVSGAATVTEASATAKLVAEGIAVLAISTANPGLDGDPAAGATDYVAQCGPPAGTPGQATRITNATGGALAVGINAGSIVNTIIKLVTAAVGTIQNVNLVPSAGVAPFVTSITPAGGYGPLTGDGEHVLTFRVRFTGIACGAEEQLVNGSLDVVADTKVIASKTVQITVPACAIVYSVKFICGVQAQCGCDCAPVQPGVYATEINIHNYSLKPVELLKRLVPLVLAGAAAGREPRVAAPRAEERMRLPAQAATMDDCCHIMELLLGAAPSAAPPLTIGFLEITASAPVAITAVYTSSGAHPGAGVSIHVEQIEARR